MAKANWQCPSEWSEWSDWLAAGLHARNRWRFPVLLTGILFAVGRRTVSSWLRAVGVGDDYQDYYYFLAPLGRKTGSVATQLFLLLLRTLPLPDRLLVVIDDSPTKRYGPKVEGADIHHDPTPGPADQKYLYGHIWVTLSLTLRLFSTDPQASVAEILEAFADRATIEQDFHDVKEVWGAGRQQVRNIWTNVAVYHLNLWMHTLVELWAWNRRHAELCDRRDSPWDDPERRPSHADRRKALRRHILQTELSTVTAIWSLPRKILRMTRRLIALVA
jgi:hypothetical protein